ncbi:MAG: hypothetical protein J1F27_05930, partial [Prevotellaceae bacterium]|nr:hypothetical protein [Prevotellaceae bacterium]
MYRKLFKSMFAGVFLLLPLSVLADVEINEENFPDEVFREYLLSLNCGKDGILSNWEIQEFTFMDISNSSIVNLAGLQYFSALKYIEIFDCDKLKEIPGLGNLHALESLNIRNCPQLISLGFVGEPFSQDYFRLYDALKYIGIENCEQLE